MNVRLCLGVGLFSACLLSPNLAQADSEARGAGSIRRTSLLIGCSLSLEGGTSYGKVEDFLLSDAGCVESLVVAADDGYIVIPWAAATVNFEKRTIGVSVSRESLRGLRFEKSEWQHVGEAAYRDRVQKVFGAKATGERRPEGTEGAKTPPAKEPTTRPEQPKTPGSDDKRPEPKPVETPRPKAEEPRRQPAEPPQPKKEETPKPGAPRPPQY
jgi:hypothetical protein